MKNAKKLLAYSAMFIGMFSLMGAACDDLEDALSLDVGINDTHIVPIDISQADLDEAEQSDDFETGEFNGQTVIFFNQQDSFTAADDEIDEYKERVEELTINSVTIVAKNITLAPSNDSNTGIIYKISGLNGGTYTEDMISFGKIRTPYTLALSAAQLEAIKEKILNQEPINYTVSTGTADPLKFDLEVVVDGTLKVSAK